MTRTEFDAKVRELKAAKGQAIRQVAGLQAEIKEEIASKYRQINEAKKGINKLQQSMQGYNQRRIAIENEWGAKVNEFIRENEPFTTSNLADAETVNIVYELRRRGWQGVITKVDENGELVGRFDLQKQFEPDADMMV